MFVEVRLEVKVVMDIPFCKMGYFTSVGSLTIFAGEEHQLLILLMELSLCCGVKGAQKW